MFCAINGTLRRQRRHLLVLAAVVALAGAVVTAHSVMAHDHVSDAVVVCLAVAETAVGIGTTLALRVRQRHTPWLLPEPLEPRLPIAVLAAPGRSRAGPPLLQIFRL